MMQISKLTMQHKARPQRMNCWIRKGFMMHVSRAITASLGNPKAMTPKGNPRMVKRIAFYFWVRERVLKCLPLPHRIATIVSAT